MCALNAADEKKITQTCTIPASSTSTDAAKQDYVFMATYYYDGEEFWASIDHGFCTKTWTAPSGEEWNNCGKAEGFDHNVQTMITTNFENEWNWEFSNKEVRAIFWIESRDTYLHTYINFDNLSPTILQEMHSSSTMRFLWDWDFTDSLWNWRNRMPTSI